jgi:hypothetical protein
MPCQVQHCLNYGNMLLLEERGICPSLHLSFFESRTQAMHVPLSLTWRRPTRCRLRVFPTQSSSEFASSIRSQEVGIDYLHVLMRDLIDDQRQQQQGTVDRRVREGASRQPPAHRKRPKRELHIQDPHPSDPRLDTSQQTCGSLHACSV